MVNYAVIGSLALVVSTLGVLALIPASTPQFTDENGAPLPSSIATIEKMELGGAEQWLVIRGRDVTNPVLLFLHGGPGTPETPFLHRYNENLEDVFVVVSWEQRGAGKSYSSDIPPESMTMEQFIADTHELTQYLKERFGQEKIYLVGHSWGTLLGVRTAHRYPEDYHALVSIAQTSHAAREEALIYDWVLEQAKQDGNRKALRELERIGEPTAGQLSLSDLSIKLKWVNHYGGGAFYGRNGFSELAWTVLRSRVYTLKEKLLYLKGESFTLDHLYDEIGTVDLFSEVGELELPVYFFHGRHDYQVPMQVAREYFDTLRAPRKEFFVFENSAHGVLFEEPEKFHDLMKNVVLKEAVGEHREVLHTGATGAARKSQARARRDADKGGRSRVARTDRASPHRDGGRHRPNGRAGTGACPPLARARRGDDRRRPGHPAIHERNVVAGGEHSEQDLRKDHLNGRALELGHEVVMQQPALDPVDRLPALVR